MGIPVNPGIIPRHIVRNDQNDIRSLPENQERQEKERRRKSLHRLNSIEIPCTLNVLPSRLEPSLQNISESRLCSQEALPLQQLVGRKPSSVVPDRD